MSPPIIIRNSVGVGATGLAIYSLLVADDNLDLMPIPWMLLNGPGVSVDANGDLEPLSPPPVDILDTNFEFDNNGDVMPVVP